MSDTIAGLGSIADSTYGQGQGSKQPPDERTGHEEGHFDASDEPDLLLIIEDDHNGETPVYKTVDRRTGAVVQSLDGEEVLRLGEEKTYIAGQLIKASA